LFEKYPVPDGVISVAEDDGSLFWFPYATRDGARYLCNGIIVQKVESTDTLLGVDLSLSLNEIEYVKLEWDFLIGDVLVTHYLQWESTSGGFWQQGDEFVELRILAPTGRVQIERLSALYGTLDEGEFDKKFQLKIIEEEDLIRIVRDKRD